MSAAATDPDRPRRLLEEVLARPEFQGGAASPGWLAELLDRLFGTAGRIPDWLGAGVTVGLPLGRQRRKSGLAEAEAQARAAAGLAESARQKLRYRTEERLARLAATARIASLYELGIIPQDRMSVDAALANYQSGKLPFVAVLEALTTLYEDRSTHLGLLADHERTRASLDEASLEESGGLR